ncbi:serum amyloid A-5 protein-like [Hyla sarda]|uniref:serum amyloid A-5 protein-like n=1 Tax=Hyla sarda TaxID=327740 RepID=UPI0024C2D034|nr:serum amyloid A-5 protein-like [Hyla sarda]XP_056383821.1 serum amyloid A-5 protein-like [Hyla sarda]XP_056383822.1 serum amyloid A-5 protein-like [Hyla sarda]XP_056383823.1 serum amyloid A-5 protein-like [Hyla sarda]
MRLSVLVLLLLSVALAQAQLWKRFMDRGRQVKNNVRDAARFSKQAVQGSRDMARAYKDMREANFKNSDKYFHARGNYDAANRGKGGAWAARVISNARERVQTIGGRNLADSAADQRANKWGRSGKDPNHFRPKGLPRKY